MGTDSSARYGAAAGAIAIAVYVAGAAIIGTPPDFDAPARDVVAYLHQDRKAIQLGSAIQAAWAPLFVWFLATVASLARAAGPGAKRAGSVAFGCGLIFIALFLADVTSLAVAALRPENMASNPELAVALHDFSWLAMGMASFVAAGVLAAFAVLALRHNAVWPVWLGWVAALAAPLYALRAGSLFTTHGLFAADGVIGLYVPVISIAGWIVVASVFLTFRLRSES